MSTTWNKELALTIKQNNDTSPLVAKAPADEKIWDTTFDASYGTSEGPPVLAWTEDNVYFPAVYDGAEWLDSAPRNPQPEGQGHVGGE